MKKLKRLKIPLTLSLGIIAGFYLSVFLSTGGIYVSWPLTKSGTYSASSSSNPVHLQKTLADNSLTDPVRCSAIFSLFAHHVPYGVDRTSFGGLFPDNSWVGASQVGIVTVEGGRSVLQGGSHCSHVWVSPFSKTGLERWSLHLCLEGDGDESDAVNFLSNAGPSKFTRIKNFSLVYPKASAGGLRIEEFYWWGMRLENTPY
jgi:hypothetical protein